MKNERSYFGDPSSAERKIVSKLKKKKKIDENRNYAAKTLLSTC